MSDNILQETIEGLQADMELTVPDGLSEDELLLLLADRIVDVIAEGAEPFFQLMYRLDIPEDKLRAILHDPEPPLKIARLVYDRQLQKIQSRRNNRMKDDNADPELKW